MRSCLVLGSGRSGTSMVAGTLAAAGYHMGDRLYRARAANPRGFFEDPEINGINEELLAPITPAAQGLGPLQRWLAVPPPGARPVPTPEIEARIRAATARRPFCYKDPRFCHTLPAWRPHIGDAALVCVFRHPALTAASIVEEVRTAAYLDGVEVDAARALGIWTAAYRRVLEERAEGGDWLFLHFEQVLAGDGLDRLAALLGADVDRSFPDRHLRRPPPAMPLPAETAEIYEELCARAGFRSGGAAVAVPRPRVSAVAVVGPGEEALAAGLVEQVRAQRGVDCELVIVDHTDDGGLEVPGARVVREPSWSRGAAWRRAAEAARHDVVVMLDPHVRLLPSAVSRVVDALGSAPGAWAAAGPLHRERPGDGFVGRVEPAGGGGHWWAGAAVRRDRLARADHRAFFPVEIDLLRRAAAEGALARTGEPLGAVDETTAEERGSRLAREAAALDAMTRPPEREPELSVLVCTYNRRRTLRECLDSFVLQDAPLGTYEIVVVDDGSDDGTAEALDGLRLPVPQALRRRPNGGLAAARNTGLAACRGRLVLFVNDDTIAAVDLVRAHVEAHRRVAPARVAVLGSFAWPDPDRALTRAMDRDPLVFCYSEMRPGHLHHPRFFWTCNVSVPLAAVRAVGGFDTRYRHYGAEDTDLGLRLGRLGYQVLYEPLARALHRHRIDVDALARRNRLVARAHVRLFRDHPEMADLFGAASLTVDECRVRLERTAALEEPAMAAARELAGTDLGALERLGRSWRELATAHLEHLREVLRFLNGRWWTRGFLDGMREHGVESMVEIVAARPMRAPGARGRVLVAFPDRADEPRWTAVVERFLEAFAGDDGRTLVLCAGGERGYAEDALRAAVDGLARRAAVRTGGPVGRVVVVGTRLSESRRIRLLAGAHAWVPTGSAADEAVRGWARRLDVPEEDPAAWPGAGRFRPVPPLAVGTPAPWRLLAWPDWSRGEALDALMRALGPVLGRSDVAVCLRHDPERDGPVEAAVGALERAFEAVHGAEANLDVLLVDDRLDAAGLDRLARSVDAVVAPPGGGAPPEDLALPVLAGAEAVADWLARIDRLARPEEPEPLRAQAG